MGRTLQTSHPSSHTSMILSATPTASRIKGTGIKAAADCSTFKVCFPVAMKYFTVEGTTSRGFSDDFWIQMYVRDKRRIRIDPLTVALEFLSISRLSGSTEVHSSIAEIIAGSLPVGSCKQTCVREMAGYEPILSPLPLNPSPKLGPSQRQVPSLSKRLGLPVHFQAVPGRS